MNKLWFYVCFCIIIFTQACTKNHARKNLNQGGVIRNSTGVGLNYSHAFENNWLNDKGVNYLNFSAVKAEETTAKFGGKDEAYGQKDVDRVSDKSSNRYFFEYQIAPFVTGFYLSVGYLSMGREEKKVYLKKALRRIGNNTYNTSLEVISKRDPWKGFIGGIGFRNVYDESEYSFGLPITFGIGVNFGGKVLTPDEVIVQGNDAVILQDDLDLFKQKVKEEDGYYIGNVFLTFGIAF